MFDSDLFGKNPREQESSVCLFSTTSEHVSKNCSPSSLVGESSTVGTIGCVGTSSSISLNSSFVGNGLHFCGIVAMLLMDPEDLTGNDLAGCEVNDGDGDSRTSA